MKHVCLPCHARRIIPVETGPENVYMGSSRWTSILKRELSAVPFPTNVIPKSVSMVLHKQNVDGVWTTYARIGKHYYAFRSFYQRPQNVWVSDVPVKMHFTLEQKQDITAAAMHPKRFGRLLDEWGEGVFDYFGR